MIFDPIMARRNAYTIRRAAPDINHRTSCRGPRGSASLPSASPHQIVTFSSRRPVIVKATNWFQTLIICKYARNVSPNRELWGYWEFADRRAHRDGWIDRFLLFSILRLAHDLCEPSGFGTRGTIYFITSLSASPPETDVSVELEYSLNSISFSGRCRGGV